MLVREIKIENTQDEQSAENIDGIKILGNYSPSGHSASRVVDPSGLAPTVMENHGTVTATLVMPIIDPEREKSQNGRIIKDAGEPMFTLTSQDRHGIVIANTSQNPEGLAIREATQKGYAMAYPGDGVNVGMPLSTTRRGRVNHGLANTITANADMGVVDPATVRIRKLTPRECWRLQGFPDEYFDRAKAAGVSDSQLYKQAGNAVTVNVAFAIGTRLMELVREREKEGGTGDE